ncbi:aspartyl/asparaginyl beta-hydroxylase domain-containing protein [Streptomyces umbrinus]|uniref:aspartyl/asparaginyl beta-hydroxylase domain-containing protein n=1 Tax=Streptomyces umbrinus TaxID=67370 RepID=UPI0027D79B32|nr:aspartyl/asparaginyl beta-hydroxylase domain-containing protein [Streptomyces umbrinus]
MPLDLVLRDLHRAEALGAPTRGVAYGESQSGGWWTTSLMNHSGDPHDVVIGDGCPQPTSLLEEMPATARFLDSLGLNFMYVRLARLEPHSYLWEHRDYAELSERGRHRLHVPLVTNASAVLVTAGARVHMGAGSLWRLTPSQAHGVCNSTGLDRLHLIADVYADDTYGALAARPYLRDGDAADLPEMTSADRAGLLERAGGRRVRPDRRTPRGPPRGRRRRPLAGGEGAPARPPLTSPRSLHPRGHRMPTPRTSAHRTHPAGGAGARAPAGAARRPG